MTTLYLAIYETTEGGRLGLYQLQADPLLTSGEYSVWSITPLHEKAGATVLWHEAEPAVREAILPYVKPGEESIAVGLRRFVALDRQETLSWLRQQNNAHQERLRQLLAGAEAVGFRLTVMDIEEAITHE